ncbi:glutathione S-transferase isoform X1 [Ptiloglossa arizonensis]|uniref:glutathione S-transferase isoform X1 n=1 Tax=Ptiloglossa arizonensis TaxID=3350558 RepID=UPI003FA182D3
MESRGCGASGGGEQVVPKEHEDPGFVRFACELSASPARRECSSSWPRVVDYTSARGLWRSRLEKMSEGQSTYKLICLDARGSAEQIRYIFAYADIEYIEETIPKESGPLVQKSVPYGILPLVEIDGKPIVQSNAVSRYLARKHNLTGRDEWEAMLCDVLVDTLEDLKRIIFQYRTEKDQFKKEEKKAKLLKETIPFYLKQFEQTIGENGGYAVGSTTTWADFVFAVALENFENIFGTTALGNYPGLRALKNRVHEIPAIANFLANRPRTKF